MTEPEKPLEEARKLGIACDDELRLNHRNPILYMQAIKHMKHVFKSFKPDIVSAHMNECSWMPGMVARFCCPNAIVARVRTDIAAPKKHPINLYINHRWTDHIICGSQLHKSVCCQNLLLPPEKLSVIYGSVDSEKFKPSNDLSFREEIGITNEDFLVCLLGRLSPVKGHEYAIEAISLLKDIKPKIKLLCLAHESERNFAWLKAEAERMGVLNRLIYEAHRSDLPHILNSIDLGIIASLGSEANSRATLEYMASGKAVIGTKVGVIPELISENENGYVVEPANSEQLAEAIKKLALNPSKCKEFGKTSRLRVEENFSNQQFGRQMESVYKSLLYNRKLPDFIHAKL